MLKRLFRIASAHTDELIKTLERPVPVLKKACVEIEERGIKLLSKSKELEEKVDRLPYNTSPDIKQTYINLSKQLKKKSKFYADKHKEFEAKIIELEARKDLAKAVKDTHSLLGSGSPIRILKEAEEEVVRLECEAKAIMEFKEEYEVGEGSVL